MALRVNNLAMGSRRFRVISLAVSSSENDYVLYDKLSAAGHRPNEPTNAGGRTIIKVTLSNSVIIGSTSTSTAGFRTHDGDTYGAGWAAADCQIIVEGTNTATIQGKGGAGGVGYQGVPGIDDTTGGGGGGGAGTQVGAGGASAVDSGLPGTQSAGGNGGAGSLTGSVAPTAAGAGANGGTALEASSGGPNITLRPATGATLRVWGGGGGGGGGGSNASGGAGGGPGLDGSAGSGGGGAAGSNGLAYSTPGSATITETGPGTIDDRGT